MSVSVRIVPTDRSDTLRAVVRIELPCSDPIECCMKFSNILLLEDLEYCLLTHPYKSLILDGVGEKLKEVLARKIRSGKAEFEVVKELVSDGGVVEVKLLNRGVEEIE